MFFDNNWHSKYIKEDYVEQVDKFYIEIHDRLIKDIKLNDARIEYYRNKALQKTVSHYLKKHDIVFKDKGKAKQLHLNLKELDPPVPLLKTSAYEHASILYGYYFYQLDESEFKSDYRSKVLARVIDVLWLNPMDNFDELMNDYEVKHWTKRKDRIVNANYGVRIF